MTLVHFQSTYGGISANAAQENVSGPSFCPENTYGNIRKIPVQNVFRPLSALKILTVTQGKTLHKNILCPLPVLKTLTVT